MWSDRITIQHCTPAVRQCYTFNGQIVYENFIRYRFFCLRKKLDLNQKNLTWTFLTSVASYPIKFCVDLQGWSHPPQQSVAAARMAYTYKFGGNRIGAEPTSWGDHSYERTGNKKDDETGDVVRVRAAAGKKRTCPCTDVDLALSTYRIRSGVGRAGLVTTLVAAPRRKSFLRGGTAFDVVDRRQVGTDGGCGAEGKNPRYRPLNFSFEKRIFSLPPYL